MITFDISCAKASAINISAEGSYIQLKGRDCSKGTAKKPMTITNKTNGFQASIFGLNKNEYQTDLIQLKKGDNQISIQFESADGVFEESVVSVKAENI